MEPDDAVQAGSDFWWAGLIARVLHPVHVEIIEALRWIGEPLTAADLLRVLEKQRAELRIERRLQQLARLDAVALDDVEKAPGPLGQHSYRLVRRARS